MNTCIKIIVLFIALAIGNVIYFLKKTPYIPELQEDSWWGPGNSKKEDATIHPFTINVSDEILTDLQYRLKHHKSIRTSLEGAHQHFGIHNNVISKVIAFWRDEYDWKAQEHFLNSLPQFQTAIQGMNIHFIHVKPKDPPTNVKVIPLLLMHGWPGTIREFYEIVPLLTTPQKGQDMVFEVVIPSLPGYGFSEGASRPGLSAARVAVVFKMLMQRLGFDKFYVQGGDWGAMIATHMAVLYPEQVKGMHSNMCISTMPITFIKMILGSIWPSFIVEPEDQHRLYPLSNIISKMFLEFGYMHLQATKPDTIGVALTDSPVGLAAYILEKFTTWTNSEWKNRDDGGLLEKYTYTKLLDNIMIYWVTSSITTSMRLYAETFDPKNIDFKLVAPVQVYTACANFRNELFFQPESLLKDRFPKLVHCSKYDGGHFAAFEMANIMANDIWVAVSKMELLHSK